LLAHWIFDSAHISGSTVTDASGNGNTATLAGSPAIVAGRGAMEAVSFNGTTQRVTTSLVLSTTNAAQPYCIVAIINTTDGTGAILQQYVSTATRFVFYVLANKIAWWKGGVTSAVSALSVNDGTWRMLAGAKTGSGAGQVQIYVDGSANGSAGTDAAAFENTTVALMGNSVFESGLLERILIFNTAKSAADIAALHSYFFP